MPTEVFVGVRVGGGEGGGEFILWGGGREEGVTIRWSDEIVFVLDINYFKLFTILCAY